MFCYNRGMKKKMLIIISAAVLCVLVAVFIVTAVKGSSSEKTARQTSAASQSVSVQATAQNSGISTTSAASKKTGADEKNGSTTRNSADSQSKNNNNDKTAAQRETAAEKKETTQKQKITVTFSVTCKNALAYEKTTQKGHELHLNLPQSGYIIGQTEITLKNGQTVFDALEAACDKNSVSLRYQSKSYITEIGGLAEKDCGGASGWMYRVNGTNPRKAASKYVLKDGDTVEWYYVTSASDN